MKKNISKKLSKATILLVAFVALTMVFTIYQTSINNKLNDALEGTNLGIIQNSPDTAVAASGGNAGSQQNKSISFSAGTYSYTVSLNSSVGDLERYWTTDSDGTNNIDTVLYDHTVSYSGTYWEFGHTRTHSGDDYNIVIMRFYLGDKIARLAATGCVTVDFSATIKVSGNGGTVRVGLGSSSTANTNQYVTTYSAAWSGIESGFSGTTKHLYKQSTSTDGETASCSGAKLAGQYMYFAAGVSDPGQKMSIFYMSDISLKINITDKTAPTIGGESSGQVEQTSNIINLADNASGLVSYSIEHTDGDKKGTVSLSTTISESAYPTSVTGTMSKRGTYKITLTDQAGNSSTVTVVYYTEVTATADPSDGGRVAVYDVDNVASSDSYKGPINSSDLYIQFLPGYYFDGMTGQATISVSSFHYGGAYDTTHYWYYNKDLTANPTMSKFSYTANFKDLAGLLKTDGRSGSIGSYTFTYDYTGKAIFGQGTLPNDTYTMNIKYYGTTKGGNSWGTDTAPTTDAPIYAGTYTAVVTLNYDSNPIGYGTYTIVINPVTLEAKPNIADKIYDGKTDAQQNNGANDWTFVDGTSKILAVGDSNVTNDKGDEISVTTSSGFTFHFDSKDVVLGKDNKVTTQSVYICDANGNKTSAVAAYISTTKTNTNYTADQNTDLQENILASYTFKTSDTGVVAKISPAELTISIGNYVNQLPSTIYINNTAISSSGYIGKVYDGLNEHFIDKLNISGAIAGEEIIVNKTSSGSYILATVGGDPKSQTSVGEKEITTEELSLTGGCQYNYYVKLSDDSATYGSTESPYSDQKFTFVIKNVYITQRPISIEIEANGDVSKTYDGSTYFSNTNGAVTVKLSNGSSFVKIAVDGQEAKVDEVTISSTNAVMHFDDPTANYSVTLADGTGTEKTLTAKGYAIVDSKGTGVASNYCLVAQPTPISSEDFKIYTREITATVTVADKVYDGTKTAESVVTYDNTSWSIEQLNDDGYLIKDDEGNPLTQAYGIANDGVELSVYTPPVFGDVIVNKYNTMSAVLRMSEGGYTNYHFANGAQDKDGHEVTISNLSAEITAKPLSHADISIELDKYSSNYDTNPHAPIPTVKDKDVAGEEQTLDENSYEYAYYTENDKNNALNNFVNAGEYIVKITAKGNYSGSVEKSYTIKKARVRVEVKDDITIQYGDSYFAGNDTDGYYHESFNSQTNRLIVTTNENNTSDVIKGNWFYNGTLTDYPIVQDDPHVLNVSFVIDTTNEYNKNYDLTDDSSSSELEGTSGIKVNLIVQKRPITLLINDQSMTFGLDPKATFNTSSFDYQEDSLMLVADGNFANDSTKDLSVFGTLSCEITSKKYPKTVEDFVFYDNNHAQIKNSDLLMAGNYTITPNENYATHNSYNLLDFYDVTWVYKKTTLDADSNEVVEYIELEKDNGNYKNGATFTVNQRPISLTAEALNKVYGETDPVFTYTATDLVVSGPLQFLLVGSLGRDEGEDVRSYNYTAGTLKPEAKASYTVDEYSIYYNIINYKFENSEGNNTFDITTNKFEITEKSIYFDLSGYTETSIFGDDIEINHSNYVLTDGTDETKTGESAVLGNGDTIEDEDDFPQLKIVRTDATTGTDATETITVGSYNLSLYYKDKLTGEWVKVPTEKAQETNKLNTNYMAYATQGSWEIQKRPVVVEPNLTNTQKVYSAKDPAAITAPTSYTTTYDGESSNDGESSKPGAIDGYPINGSLGRVTGEDVLIEENGYGKYLFTQGTVKDDINPNYTITFANPKNLGLTIMPLQVELMPTDTRKATEVLNAVTYPELTDLASYEQYEASLAEKAGKLRISFTATPVTVQNQYDESAIYDLGLVVDSTGIKNKIISIGGGFVLPKEYEFTYVDGGNTLTKTDAYPTTVGLYDLKLNNVTDGPEFNNYIFTVRQIEALGSFEIQPLRALIVPDADQSIVYGQDVPTITYKAYDPNDLSSVIDNANFEGALRVNGTLNSDGYLNVGNQYAIVNDNLTSANYKVEFGDAVYFKVTPKPVTVSLNGVDSSNTIKIIYGNASPLIPLLDANTEGDSFYPYTFSLNGLVPSKATNEIDYSSFAYSFAKKVALSDNGQVITLGTLEQANANYTYTFDKTYKLQITARPITITPIAGLSQQFGDGMSGSVSNSSSYTTSYNALAQDNNGEEFTVIDNLSQINMSSIISLSKEAGTDYWMIRIAGMKQATHLVTSADEKVTELGGTLYAYEDGELLFTFKFDKHSNNNPYFIITSSDAVGSREYDGTAYDYYLTRRSLLPGDSITGQLSVDYGTYSDNTAPIGEYGYNLGTLSANNYDLTLDTNSPKYTVVVRPLEIKLTGTINITFGDTVTSVENYALFEADGETESYYQLAIPFILPTGTLIPGYYPINVDIAQSNTTHSNFTFSFNAEDYTEYLIVSKRTITLTPAVGQSKMYMEELPALTYATTGEFVEGYVPANEAFNLSIVGITSEQEAKMARTGTHNYQFNINNDYVLADGVVLSDCYNIITALEDANGQAITFSVYRATTTITIPDAVATDETNRNFALTLTYNGNAQTIVPELDTGRYDADGTEIGHIEYFDEDGMPIDELSFKDAGSYLVEVYANVDTTKFTEKSVFLTINIKKYALAEVDPTDKNYGLALEKIYGEADGNLEFQIDGIGADGKLSASLKREEGEAVGSYNITEIIFVNSNYEVSFKACSYEIKAKALEITPNNIENSTKIYGEADGELYEDIAGVNDETLRVIYSRTAGENVGKYDVAFSKVIKLTTDEFGAIVPVKDEFGNYVENANYSVTLADGTGTEKYEITKRKATVTAVSVQKVFDSIAVDLDSLSYNTENVVSGETLVGSITILTGAPVEAGTYAIVLEGFNEAPENSNYDITLVNATCVISPTPISIKAVSVTYEYGDTIADFDYEVSGTVYAGYPLEGKLALGANNQIVSGTLNNNAGRNPNYKITYLSGGVCTITPRHITITVLESVEQVYGNELTAIPYAVTSANGLADGDEALLGSLAPSGKDVNLEGYTIEMGTLQELNPNYLITLETADHKYIITPRPISVTVEPKTIVYGDEPIALEYTAEGLIGEDTLNGDLYCDLGTDAKSYPITQGTLNHPNYEITTFNGADYTITPRAIVVTIKDAESDFGQEIAELEWYISKGRLIGQDDLGIVLTKAEGTTMGTYEITGSFNNDNYTVEFVNGTYTIHKYQAVITVANQFITFIEDGDARSIQAECSSGAEIIFTVKGEEVSNYFREAGKYTVELTAPETDNYYAPEEVIVYITINRPVLKTEANGIDVTLTTENGFDPNLSIEMEKLPTDYMDMIAELTSKQKIVRAFTLTSINEDTLIEEVEGKTTVTIKVPTMLSEQETVQVLVREDGEYDIIEVEVLDGYVTLEVDSLSSFAFITEENTNYLLLILIGVAALIMLGSVMVFLFRKRA